MTTITVTQTQQKASETLVLRLTSEELSIDAVVKKMLSSHIFSVSEQSQITHWASEANNLDQSEDIAVALCYLLFTVIHPALLSSTDNMENLLAFEDEIKELLKCHIPEEKNVDEFIEERSAEQIVINQIAAIEEDFKKLTDHLYTSANVTNQHMGTAFGDLKVRLQTLNENAQSLNSQLKEHIELLFKEVEQMNLNAQSVATSMRSLGEKLDNQQLSMLKDI